MIGRLVDTDVARSWPDHELLPRQGWSRARNDAFVQDAVTKRRRVLVASPIVRDNLVDRAGALTLFGFELAAFFAAGYGQRGAMLWPPPLDAVGDALAADPAGFYRRLRARDRSDTRVAELVPVLEQIAQACPALRADAVALATAGAPYAETIRCAHAFAAVVDDELRRQQNLPAPIYGPKVEGELEPLLALFPDVVVFPTFVMRAPGFFVTTRAAPIHPLGLIEAPLYSDGAVLSPLEYFWHDVDHARFMVREELRSRGLEVADAYQAPPGGGAPTTLIDAGRNVHRTILPSLDGDAVAVALNDERRIDERAALTRALRDQMATLVPAHADAVELLLFELVHEKGFPLDAQVLRAQCADRRHVDKLTHKLTTGFYGDVLGAERAAGLGPAHDWLTSVLP